MYGISGTSPTDVYAVGEEYSYDVEPEYQTTAVDHYDGAEWTEVLEKTIYYDSASANEYRLQAVWANASDDVFVVGSNGRIFHYDGGSWSPMRAGSAWDLRDVWGRARNDVYAVGPSGVVRYDGTLWAVINDTPSSGIWGTATDIFVITEGGILHGSP